MTVYREPPKNASRRSIGNLDGASNGIGGTDSVRIQAGSGDFMKAAPTVVDNSYVSGKSANLEIKMQNVGGGAGVFARREKDNQTYSFRRIQGGDGVSVIEGLDSIIINASSGVDRFINLKDVPGSFQGQAGKTLVVDEDHNRLVFQEFPNPVTNFLALTDTPDSYQDANGQFLSVNTATGQLVFKEVVFPEQGARITFAAVPPSGALQGDGWWNTTDGTFFLYYSDGTSAQWVESGSSSPQQTPQTVFAYDYGAFFDGQPGASEVLYRWRAPRAHQLADNFLGCIFTAGVNPSATYVATVWINGAQVGTWTLNSSGASTLVSSGTGPIDVPANQEIKIIGSPQSDGTLADLVLSFKGERY
jgi:hypothetical protein